MRPLALASSFARASPLVRALALLGAGPLAGGLSGCGGELDAAEPPAVGDGIGLLSLPPARIDVPSQESAAQERVSLRGPWRLVSASHGVRSYEAPLPIRPRALYFERAPEGMELTRRGEVWRYGTTPLDVDRARTWRITAESVIVRVGPTTPHPSQDDGYELLYAPAAEREAALYRPASEDAWTWARRTTQVGDVSREGVLLPAPARVAWELDIPEGGVLVTQLGLLPPEQDDGVRSDGTFVEVSVDNRPVHTVRVKAGAFTPLRVDLGAWRGKRVRLAVAVQDQDTRRDHLFVADPRVIVPKKSPRRVVLAFVDTLRRDHMSLYGYRRETTPQLDAWAREAVVFEDARTVAPWTLPSTRTVLTGAQPEAWESATTLQETLAAKGWATGAFVGNVYLSSNFDMARGFGEQGCLNWPGAELEVRRARDFLERHAEEDAFLLLHFMDLHLPYKEPARYQGLWAGKAPFDLPPLFNRANVLMSAARDPQRLHTYLVDRYDQNLRYVDDTLALFLQELGEDAVVVFFADHGEEFWDHGDFEHGHTLYDELLRVPLIVKAPGLAPRRVNVPASLLDVTPTVLEALGMAPPAPVGEGPMGVSLVQTARGQEDPRLKRPLAFGRPLYGGDAWGSLEGSAKYVTRGGLEQLFDLKTDPGEKRNLRFEGAEPSAGRQALAKAVGRPVMQALRVMPADKRPGGPWELTIRVPGGIAQAWVGEDPTQKSEAEVKLSEDRTEATLSFGESIGIHREIFLVPQGADPVAAVRGTTAALGGWAPQELVDRAWDGSAEPLARLGRSNAPLSITWTALPLPAEGGSIDATDGEMAGALEALGYMERVPPPTPSGPEKDGE